MVVVKKSTSKSSTSKKSSSAKKASSSTTRKTSTVKKAATSKLTTKTSVQKTVTEISVTGNKKIGTLMKEFNKKFPYLRLGIFYSYARAQVAKGERIKHIDIDKTLASVRRADSGGGISISGNKKIKT